MLRIRPEQIAALAEARKATLREALVAHARKYFAEETAPATDDELLAIAGRAIERAARYRIDEPRDVCLFLNLMFVLGPDFDTDPALTWAARTLSRIPDERTIDDLYREAMLRVR